MSPEAFEAAIIEQISAQNLSVIAYPENPKNYYPENDAGDVLVRYEGRKILERDLANGRNKVKLFAEVVIVSRQLRGETGAFVWLQQIYKALEGFTLLGSAGPLNLEAESYMDENDGIWQYGQKWSMVTYEFIDCPEEEAAEVLFTRPIRSTQFPYELPFLVS